MAVLNEVVRSFLETAVSPVNLLSSAHRLVVGVSGGPDSLALLHVLTTLAPPARLVAAHVDHGYRETAVAEAAFVQNTAQAWGLACAMTQVDVAQLAHDTGDSLEEAGRKARYAFLQTVAAAYETPYILVGHHGDDQAETVLMNLLRGSGLRGLRGMLPVAPLPHHPEFVLLRPFLPVARQDIEAYCQANELTPVFDESNEDVSFFRNRIRRELLPLLAEYNAGIRPHLQQLAAVATADVALLDELAADAWVNVALSVDETAVVLDRAGWAALPLSLRRAALRRAMGEKRPFSPEISFQAVEQARLVAERNESGQRYNLPGNLHLRVDYERLIIAEDEPVLLDDWPQLADQEAVRLPVPGGVALADGWRIEAEWVETMSAADIQAQADNWRVFIDRAAAGALTVRCRQPGERFQPLGMHGRSAKVQDVMVNLKIGAAWRAKWPLVANAEHVIWVVGHRLDERAKVTEKTAQIVQLHCFKG